MLTNPGKSKARSVVFSPNGEYLAASFSSSDKNILLWKKDAANVWGKSIELGHHSDGVWCLAFSPDSLYLASGSWDSSIRLWDYKSKEKVLTLRGHSGPVTSIEFLNDSTLASGSWDQSIRLWDIQTGNELDVINTHKGTVFSLATNKDWGRLVSGSADRTMRIHNIYPNINSDRLGIEQYESLFNSFQDMLPYQLTNDNLLDSKTNFFLSPLTENDPFKRTFSKWLYEPRPRDEEVFDWIIADSKIEK